MQSMNRDAVKRTSVLNLHTDPGTINFSTLWEMLAGLYAQPGRSVNLWHRRKRREKKVAVRNRLAPRWGPELLHGGATKTKNASARQTANAMCRLEGGATKTKNASARQSANAMWRLEGGAASG
jgi:hypothetical protein